MIPLTGPRVKDLLQGSRLARRGYAIAMNAAAAGFGASGNLLSEMHYRMRAVRADIGYSDPTRTARRLRRPLLSRLFGAPALGVVGDNRLLLSFTKSAEAERHRRFWNQFPAPDRVRMRFPRENDDPDRQGDLVVLKPWNRRTGERGVILLSFTERIRAFAAIFDLPAIAEHYQLVLQPSWWGYQDATFLLYVGQDVDVLIQSPWVPDREFLGSLDTNLRPTALGAGDWIDPDVFRPGVGAPRPFDLVMVSAWSPVKRHHDLFRALAELRRRGRVLRVALVGTPGGWTRQDIERIALRFGVLDCCTFFESIPHEEVAEVVRQSRAYVLLSRREGANRALYEAFFCDTPVLVYHKHHGVNLEQINEATGRTFATGALADSICALLDHSRVFAPREWALRHTGYRNATRQLNEELRSLAFDRGYSWRTDIVETKMAPTLRYAVREDRLAFDPEFERLAEYLWRQG